MFYNNCIHHIKFAGVLKYLTVFFLKVIDFNIIVVHYNVLIEKKTSNVRVSFIKYEPEHVNGVLSKHWYSLYNIVKWKQHNNFLFVA